MNTPSRLLPDLSLQQTAKPLEKISALVIDGVSHDSCPRITLGLVLWTMLQSLATLPTITNYYRLAVHSQETEWSS